jgi:hypothetical protein
MIRLFHTMARRVLSFVFICIALAHLVEPNTATADVLPPGALIGGQSQLHWAEAWFDWANDFPASTNPVLDVDGSQGYQGDIGPLFYLAGTVTGDPVIRNISVPADKVLFFPVLNLSIDNSNLFGEPPFTDTPQMMFDGLAKIMDPSAVDLFASIDGVPIPNVFVHQQISDPSAPFSYTVTTPDNLVTFFGYDPTFGTGVYPATVFPVMQNSYYLALEPFSPGSVHEIRFGGTINAFGFSQDNTYRITTIPEPASGMLTIGIVALVWLKRRAC